MIKGDKRWVAKRHIPKGFIEEGFQGPPSVQKAKTTLVAVSQRKTKN
jgi:hypothetical protein